MLSSTMVPVMAEDSITVGGELLYSQDFEGEVEAEMLHNPFGDANDFVVEEQNGNSFLTIDHTKKYGHNKFGPEYADAVVKVDFKQTASSGSSGAYTGLSVRAVSMGAGIYHSNVGAFFDIMKYNEETGKLDASNEKVPTTRDRLLIATTQRPQAGSFDTVDALSEERIGVLNTAQIFTSDLKHTERNTGSEFLRMQNSIIGSTVTSKLMKNDGTLVTKLQSEDTTNREKGYSQLMFHSGSYAYDNIKVMEPKEISVFFANVAENEVMLGKETQFKLSCEDDTILQSDIARYEYDKTAVNIDFAKGTVAPLKLGTHTVKVYLDDINSDNYLESSFTVTGIKAGAELEAVVENPNPAFGEGTAIKVYYGDKDVTSEAEISGASYADGIVTPDSTGLCEVVVSYNGQNVIVPIAVNNTDETISEQDTTPVFTEDFEGDAEELTAAYSNGSSAISVTSVTNTAENRTDNALCMTGGTTTTAVFGPTDLKDYVLEYDSFCYKPQGSSASFYGATMRANTKNGGYKVGIAPVMKYNETTHKVDSAGVGYDRRVSIAYSNSSANCGNWFWSGFNSSQLDANKTQGSDANWIHHKNTIAGDKIKTELKFVESTSMLTSYETSISDLNAIAGMNGFASGGTTFAQHQNVIYFDNIKIYRINSYNDINVLVKDGEITVTGVNANSTGSALSGNVKAKAYGKVTVSDTNITEGNGIGYVAVTYEDVVGNKKYKVIKTGELASGDAEEFTVISKAMLYNQEGDELDGLETGMPVFAKATVKRGALEGNGVMMAVCFYDGNELVDVYTSNVDAVQRIGDNIELYTKFKLPEGAEDMGVKVFLWDSSMKALTEEFFEI